MKNDNRTPTAILVLASILAIAAIIAAVLYVGARLPVSVAVSQEGGTRASLFIFLFGGVVMVALFSCFLWIGIEDWRHSVPISPLYWPQVSVKGTMAAYMMQTTLSVIDLLLHGLHPHWRILYTPVARIFQSILLLAVFASFAWVLIVLLRGRALVRRDIERKGILRRIRVTEIHALLAKRLALRLARRMDAQEKRIDGLAHERDSPNP